MVLPISIAAPDEPAVAVGLFDSLPFEPQPASTSAQAAIAPPAIRDCVRISGSYPVDAVRHAQFAAAVPYIRLAALVEDGLIVAVDDDVVDDVVGDDDIRRALHGDRPAAAE